MKRQPCIWALVTLAPLAALACSDSPLPPAEGTDAPTGEVDTALKKLPYWPGGVRDACPAASLGPTIHCHAKTKTYPSWVRNRPNGSSPVGVGYTPQQVQAAYNISTTSTTTITPTVGIVDAYNSHESSYESDLATYRSTFGLPPCTVASGCLTIVNQYGGTTMPTTSNTGWDVETSLDLDAVSTGCPQCNIMLVEAATEDIGSLGTALNTAVRLGASVVSNSYGATEAGYISEYGTATSKTLLASYDAAYFNHPGVDIFFSAGDADYGVQYPASSPNVISVGGTSLNTSATTRGWTETVWYNSSSQGTGSGCSTLEAAPAWQSVSSSVCSMKVGNVISAIADPGAGTSYIGLAIYDSGVPAAQGGPWGDAGGTSLASPLVASIVAGANLSAVSPGFYWNNTNLFYDVTSGSDATSCSPSILCTAGVGWDGPTGWGTPNGGLLANLPEILRPIVLGEGQSGVRE